jgi:hypothetical protein
MTSPEDAVDYMQGTGTVKGEFQQLFFLEK